MDIDIIYRDPYIVVVNKPGGLLSVPGKGADKQDCVAARLRRLFPLMIDQPAVHRLDMYTSGLMVFAISAKAHRTLSIQFSKRQVEKEYIAVLEGTVAAKGGEIHLPIRLDPENRPLQIHDPVNGKISITGWQRIDVAHQRTRVALYPVTGRTHQLRVHMAHPLGLATPIVGDSLYGHGCDGDVMLLHANRLTFTHPDSGQTCSFVSPPGF